jgi:hypothetical protein
MWHTEFALRLRDWQKLRADVKHVDLEQCLEVVNRWWFKSPWTAYHIHWDDKEIWPNPWQLLHDDIYCPLARALGIMYTLSLLERSDTQDAVLIEVESDNLVLVSSGKYVLNWCPHQIVNINPGAIDPRHRIDLSDINQLVL